ncbi:MAG: ATP-binding protein [Candidatus Peribacteria bacterium]|jgi:predicted AAA+ superfamily ATPase|nr:ATP-binding protein [Candidatus Peribacteria bacterium]
MRYKEIIQKGQKKITQFSGIKRELPSLDSLWNLKKIITILGGRKVGKTYSLLQQIQEAINTQKCTLEEVIFIDFSELDYRNINIDDLHSYVGSLGIEHPVYCFDEIQEVKDFDRQLISLYNQGCTLFITGSNSKMLSADIATILRGKTYEIRQTPLSFQEFLRFKNYETLPNDLILDQLFDEFVYRGGYPEVVLTPDERVKKGLLQGYLDLLIFKDLVDRYNIRNQALLQSFIRSLVLGHTKELNIHKLFNTYKSQGIEVGKNTLYEYLENLKHTFIISTLGQFYRKAQFEKVYLIDTGLLHCFTDNPSR